MPLNEKQPYYASYITTSEFAKVCNVTRLTVINWAKRKKIRFIQTLGGHRRIPLTELLCFLETGLGRIEEGKFEYCWEYARWIIHFNPNV